MVGPASPAGMLAALGMFTCAAGESERNGGCEPPRIGPDPTALNRRLPGTGRPWSPGLVRMRPEEGLSREGGSPEMGTLNLSRGEGWGEPRGFGGLGSVGASDEESGWP